MPSVVVFRTESGSTYRADLSALTLERLDGSGPPTDRVGREVRRFERISPIEVGRRVLVEWGAHSATPAEPGSSPCTETSRVVAVCA